MARYNRAFLKDSTIFVGVDVHQHRWHVTVMSEGVQLQSMSIAGTWEALHRVLLRYEGNRIEVAYEAGFSGFWLYDRVVSWGAVCVVIAPSLVPMEFGNRVKTDRRDSSKLALLLSKGMAPGVWVPSPQQRYHRQVIRRRRQLIQDRVRVQNRIKSELHCFGVQLDRPRRPWSQRFVVTLRRVRCGDEWMQASYDQLLTEYEFLSDLIREQTRLLQELSQTAQYRPQVELLCSIPGVGLLTAMELLLELGDIRRFARADRLAAYVGLTPSQYSSGDHIRMGRITGIGKRHLRGLLVEAAWVLIRKDRTMRDAYDRIKANSGAKRAIVAIARRLLLSCRRILLDMQPYICVETA
jgi:transposase